MKIPILCLLLLLATALSGQQTPKFGDPAPDLALDLLQAPDDARASIGALSGNALVLEFWATWCVGCVQRIPHMNELVAKFKNRPVRFISITDEDKAVVERFLPAHPIAGWIGLDRNGATFRRYGIDGRPTVALIDAKGVVRNISGSNDAVTESSIEALIEGTLPIAPQPKNVGAMGSEPDAPMPVFQAMIRPAMRDGPMGSGAERRIAGKWEGWGMPIREFLARSSGLPASRIIAPDWCDGERFDITLPVGENEEARRELLCRIIAAAFSLELRREAREIDVLVLRKPVNAGHRLAEDPYGQPLRRLVSAAELALKRPVIDETGLGGTYKFDYIRVSDVASYAATLKERTGLELIPSRRSMEVLIAEPARR